MTHRTILALLPFALAACGGSSEPAAEYPPMDDPEPTSTTTVEAVGDTGQTTPPAPPVQVVASESTPIEGAMPQVRIRSPRAGQTIRRGDVMLNVQVRNWALAADPGNHVHVIVDNEPYIAVRDVARPLSLNQLVRDNLGHELAAGSHVVRVFPSRQHHESVKDAGAFASVAFHVQEETDGFAFDATAPLLTYSRPKGCNVAGERVLLDFFLTNVPALATDGFRVRYAIGDVSGDITDWSPHYIENLPAGEHTVRLSLIGADGSPVDGPFNDTSRTVTVADTCAPPAPPPAPAAEPAAAAP